MSSIVDRAVLKAPDLESRYLDLLKLVLLDLPGQRLRGERLRAVGVADRPYDGRGPIRRRLKLLLLGFLRRRKLRLYRYDAISPDSVAPGSEALTLIQKAGLDNIEHCIRAVIRDGVPGDFIETGVWKGGASIFACGVLSALGDETRKVWVADSFRGLPPPDTIRYPVDAGDVGHQLTFLAVSQEMVKHHFETLGLLSERVRFVEGWFKDTLPLVPAERFSVVRLDGDMYESTMDALTNLYPRLSEGGFIIIDDYNLERCRAAVDEFRALHGIREVPIVESTGLAWWRRGDA